MSDVNVERTEPVNLAQIASRWKLVKYRATSNDVDVDIECSDKLYREQKVKIGLSRLGGIGLDLLEGQSYEDGTGLVMVNDVFADTNAAQTGLFQVGDVLSEIKGTKAIEGSSTEKALSAGTEKALSFKLQGQNLDKCLDALGAFGEYSDIEITVQRLVLRKLVTVKMVGPKGEDAGTLNVLSGFNVNVSLRGYIYIYLITIE